MLETSGPVPENTGKCCPCCSSVQDVIPIVYAIPTPHLRTAQRKGKVIISAPPCGPHTWYCKNCGTQWSSEGAAGGCSLKGAAAYRRHALGSYKISHTVPQEPTIGLCPDLSGHLTEVCRIFSSSRFYTYIVSYLRNNSMKLAQIYERMKPAINPSANTIIIFTGPPV